MDWEKDNWNADEVLRKKAKPVRLLKNLSAPVLSKASLFADAVEQYRAERRDGVERAAAAGRAA